MDEDGKRVRLAVVGISESTVCGVRDHSQLLAEALRRSDITASWHWLYRTGGSLAASRAEVDAWSGRLTDELAADQPAAILLVYSVFAYSYRGVPLFVPRVLSALRRSGAPIILMLHELAYPWTHGGWRGKVWALTQRAMLVPVMRASRSAVVTSDFHGAWARSRRWLPHRPLAVAPVFSNLPPPSPDAARDRGFVVGVFGYAYQGVAAALVLDAVGQLRAQGLDVRLRLAGAPGARSPAGEDWLRRARERSLQDALSFTGTLPAQELSNALAGCRVLLFPDQAGPQARKGSLAGALASGRPVVALAGPRTWDALVAEEAIRVVAPQAEALARAVRELLLDEGLADALGARGRTFAERQMGLAVTAEAVQRFLEEVIGPSSGRRQERPFRHAEAASP